LSIDVNCQTCSDPTKYIFALWDGPNGTHGRAYDCHNISCLVKRNRDIQLNALEERRAAVEEENSKNNIDMLLIKAKRRELQINIVKMSRALGISPSDYSNYEMCRVALPVEVFDNINEIFRSALWNPKPNNHIDNILNKKYGRND